jgi:hypothetical protein
MSEIDVDPEGTRVPVSGTPGRSVGVEITPIIDEPDSYYLVTLVFDEDGRYLGDESYAWLTTREARAVAAALNHWAGEAEGRNDR